MKLLYFDCFAGISGDMTVAALLDLGLPIDHLQAELEKLNLPGYQIESSRTERHKIAASKFDVTVEEHNTSRHLSDILKIIDSSTLTSSVKEFSRSAFLKLAAAEAKIHNTTPDKIHFHEVGGIDAIIDITGAAIGFDFFRPDKISISPLPLGSGTVKSSHGTLPLPAPATVAILKDFTFFHDNAAGEKVTPTGAAILAAASEMYPLVPNSGLRFNMEKIGYGAGSADFPDRPNLLRLLYGELLDYDVSTGDSVTVLECNIDDMNPQIYGHLMELLYAAGALEIFLTPVIMKKSRPGILLTILCKKDLVDKLTDIIFSETTTAGLRLRHEARLILPRHILTVETEFGKIRVKILKLKDRFKFQPEYDDCSLAAKQFNVPISKVIESARRAAEALEGI